MTDFIVTITDPDQLAGITWAREQYNATIPVPPSPEEGEEPVVPERVPLATDEEYVQWVMDQAAASYAQQAYDAQWQDAYNSAQVTRSLPGSTAL